MRIIAGSRKGARIFTSRGRHTRPTADRVREAVFNLVGPLEGSQVLDLYAGSGAMGIEALSRGAAAATFVETNLDALRTIHRNLDKLGFLEANIVRSDAMRFLASDTGQAARYDLVLIDPPYERLPGLLPTLAENLPPVVSRSGIVVLESDAGYEPELPLSMRTSRRYGSVRVTVFERGIA